MTDTYELPELPEPDGSASVVVGKVPVGPMMGDVTEEIPAWSRELVEDFARLAVKAERERAIAVVQAEIDRAEALMAVEENGAPVFDREQTDAGICALRIVAAAIRAG